jgi:signal transduction histidine kinase
LTVFVLSSLVFGALIYFSLALTLKQKDRSIIEAEFEDYMSEFRLGGIDRLMKKLDEIRYARDISGEDAFLVRLVSQEYKTVFIYIPQRWASIDLKQLEKKPVRRDKEWSYLPATDNRTIYEMRTSHLAQGFFLQIGRPTTTRQHFLNRFLTIFAVVMVLTIPIGFAGGILFTSRMLQPVHHLISTTRLIIDTSKFDARVRIGTIGDELAELSTLFNTMLNKIETLISGMRMGLDNVAHDLRTPMTRLRGIAEMALQSEKNEDILRGALVDCMEESERILAMLNTLMDISEAETGAMKLNSEKVSLSNIIEEIVDLYGYIAEEKNIAIHTFFPEELYLTGDRNRLQQALSNLLDNALKYTHDGGRIDIEASERDQQIIITVKDTGIGIPPEELPKIWDRLYRVDNSRSTRGLGLGLSLVKAVVEAHKGHIEVTSEPLSGSIFSIYLPKKL